jgi:hypothetical protein
MTPLLQLSAGSPGPLALQSSGCDRYRQQLRFPRLFRHLLTIGLQARDVSLDGPDRAVHGGLSVITWLLTR